MPPRLRSPRLTRFVWFAGLWLAGVASVAAVGLLIKVVLK